MFVRDDPPTPTWMPWRGPCPSCAAPIRIAPGEPGDTCPACGCPLRVASLEEAGPVPGQPHMTGLRLIVTAG